MRNAELVFRSLGRVAALAIALVGCGAERESDPAAGGGDAGAGPVERDSGASGPSLVERDAAGDEPPADAPQEWTSLIQGSWTIPPVTETYRCVRQTLTEDVYASAFKPLSPRGTHHTVLTLEDSPTEPDGQTECGAGTNGSVMIAASGVGTGELFMPEGVAMHLRAGQQLVLNLHLFNVSEEELSGESGTLVQLTSASEVEHLADGFLAGTLQLDIPPGRVTQQGRCTMSHDVTLFAVGGHMHQLGVHLKAVAHSSIDGEVVLHDAPYSFEEQEVHRIEEVRMQEGDVIDVECTYDNTTGEVVHWGDSSLAEMCFAGILRYPAGEGSFFVCGS
jgi:hypothetical protein